MEKIEYKRDQYENEGKEDNRRQGVNPCVLLWHCLLCVFECVCEWGVDLTGICHKPW